jgi:hypothetical protein
MDNLVVSFILLLYWFFIDFIGYSVARLAIPLLSFGRAYVRTLDAPLGRFNLLGYRRDEDGRIEVAEDVAGYLGLAIILMVILATILLVRSLF